ncbi:glyoxalase family protein [Ancylostoma duodenale]|uniref:Glyoxalase family protein n=1 Tax=Ancylostoma duodenale TaxID=51022 RepID=A0A0C2GV57_9BILA|nr:glyoxalase family protein [Ancylostoma duodenale]
MCISRRNLPSSREEVGAMTARALHYVFKIGDRKASYEFFTKVLQMKVLRHEEFEEGCKAACNGPYNGKWSKTMVGYGCEDDHFVIELTYNYEIGGYRLGNDYMGIFIESDELHKAIEGRKDAKKLPCGKLQITDPDGHWFLICPGKGPPKVVKVGVRVQDVKKSVDYWTNQLGMKVVEERDGGRVTMSYGEGQCRLEVRQLPDGTKLDRASAYGRIAFAYPDDKLSELQSKIKAAKLPIMKELVTLDTPGKASVQVVILQDPDDHEICFVGDKGFRELSKVDPKADELIRKEIEQDNSSTWFKDGKKKV